MKKSQAIQNAVNAARAAKDSYSVNQQQAAALESMAWSMVAEHLNNNPERPGSE